MIAVGIICIVASWLMYKYTCFDAEWLEGRGWFLVALGAIAAFISSIIQI